MNMDPIRYNAIYKAAPVGRTTGVGGATSIGPTTEGREEQTVKMDTITISPEAMSQRFAGSLARQIASELAAPDDAGQVEALRQAVAAGNYQVQAGAVADAILERVFFD